MEKSQEEITKKIETDDQLQDVFLNQAMPGSIMQEDEWEAPSHNEYMFF